MKFTTFLLLHSAAICLASVPHPYAAYCRELDRIAFKTSEPENRAVALELLELVAMNRTSSIKAGSELQAGVETGQLLQKGFALAGVRICAFPRIGETGLDDALDFLAAVKQADLGMDAPASIWTAAQEALANARLNKIAEPLLKTQYLESLVSPRTEASFWAVEQLCNRGSVTSINLAKTYLKLAWSGEFGEEQSRFCQDRMQVVFANPDRAKALGSVLKVEKKGTEADKLVQWAVSQLVEMDNPAANAELKRFQSEMKQLPKADVRYRELFSYSHDIDFLLEHNRLKKIAPSRR